MNGNNQVQPTSLTETKKTTQINVYECPWTQSCTRPMKATWGCGMERKHATNPHAGIELDGVEEDMK